MEPAGMVAGPLFGRVAPDSEAFRNSRYEPKPIERVIGEMIWRHQGRANPIKLSMIRQATGLDERAVKAIVADLVVRHQMKIGGSRREPLGYFVAVDAEDIEAAAGPFRDQVIAMWKRLRVLMGPRGLRELMGQLRIDELSPEAAKEKGRGENAPEQGAVLAGPPPDFGGEGQ